MYPEFMPAVSVQKLPDYAGPDFPLEPAQDGDVGVDLYAAEDVVVSPGERILVSVGIKMVIPEGYEGQVRPRSGNAIKLGLSVLNSPGTIDPGYRGEVKVIVENRNPTLSNEALNILLSVLNGEESSDKLAEQVEVDHAENVIVIERGMKIAQMVFARFERPVVLLVEDVGDSARGEGGFGSTDVPTAQAS